MPELDPGVAGVVIYEQAAIADATFTEVTLTNPTAIQIVDQSL